MKKLLLLGFILAILLLAFPQGVMAADEDQIVIIDATYAGQALSFTAEKVIEGSGGWSWPLVVNSDNQKSPALKFVVGTSSDWSVAATATDAGYMSGDLGTLKQPFSMEVNQDNTAHAVGGGLTVLSNYGPVPAGTEYDSDIWQQVNDDDYGSTNPYTITITFTCTSDI